MLVQLVYRLLQCLLKHYESPRSNCRQSTVPTVVLQQTADSLQVLQIVYKKTADSLQVLQIVYKQTADSLQVLQIVYKCHR
jgi:hypothetical protein